MNRIDGAYQITNYVQVVEVNWVLLKSYYRLPTLLSLLFFLLSLPLIHFSLFLLPSIRGMGIADCGKLIQT